jgi:translocator protein
LALIGFVGLCLLVGAASGGVMAGNGRGWYMSLAHPPGTPPNWLFAPVWIVLYLMIGVSAWLVWRHVGARPPLRLWGWQLLLNALWTPAFFGLHRPGLALAVILGLLALIVLTTRAFARVDRIAAALMLPYAAWVSYAAYLNAGLWWLNRG